MSDPSDDDVLEFPETPIRSHLAHWWVVYALSFAAVALLFYRDVTRAGDINGPIGTPLLVRSAPMSRNMWVKPDADVPGGEQIRGMMIHLGNRNHQVVTYSRGEEGHDTLHLHSRSARDSLTLTSHEFKSVPGTRFRVSGQVKAPNVELVHLGMRILARSSNQLPPLAQLTLPPDGAFSQDVDINDGSELFRVEILARFKGELSLENLSLERVAPAASPAMQ